MIFVINPNSDTRVTQQISEVVAPLRQETALELSCLTVEQGPALISRQRDADAAVMPLLQTAAALEGQAQAFVIACFSDPGIFALREESARPVFGMCECAVASALEQGERFGVIAVSEQSIPRHHRYFGILGCRERLAGELALGLDPAEFADHRMMFDSLVRKSEELRDEYGADSVVLGCAAFSIYRDELQRHLRTPVVDPTVAAVRAAIAAVQASDRD